MREKPLKVSLEKHIFYSPDGCWYWTGHHNDGGYGVILRNHRKKMAHRVSYEVYRGDIPAGLHVCHSCDNRLCVNPDHLWLGTNQDNINDKVAKGRQARTGNNYHLKTHCPYGHSYSGENLMTTKYGRICRECHRFRSREYVKKKRLSKLII